MTSAQRAALYHCKVTYRRRWPGDDERRDLHGESSEDGVTFRYIPVFRESASHRRDALRDRSNRLKALKGR